MGSEVQLERYMPGNCSARELGEEASSQAWNYYDIQFHETSVDLDSESDKDELKQKMLEHDAVFRRQVSELHRLYRTQRDLMDEMKRRELYNYHRPLSLNPLVYQRQDSSKLHSPNFPSSNSACTSPSILGAEHSSPDLSHLKRKAPKNDFLSAKDVDDSNDCEIIECQPAKVKRKVFDLQLSADAYIDPNELNQSIDLKARTPSSFCNGQSFFGERSSSTRKGNGLKDLNEPIQIEDDLPNLDYMNQRSSGKSLYTKPFSLQTLHNNFSRETSLISRYGGDYLDSKKALLVDRENNREQDSHQLSLGQFNTKSSSLSHYLLPANSQKPSQFIHRKNGTSYGTPVHVLPDHSKEKFCKDQTVYPPKFVEVGHEPHIYSLNRPSDVKCWPPTLTSWDKYGCNSSEKQPYYISSAGFSKSSQASNRPSMIFGEKLNMNSDFVVGIPRINELDRGSASGSKEESICYPSVKLENTGSGKDGAGASGCSVNFTSHKYSKGLTGFDLNRCEGMDLSGPVANDSHHETPKMEQSKDATLLPWMKPKPSSNDTARANISLTSNKFLSKTERGNMASECPPQMITESASRDHGLHLTKSTADHNTKQIHGFPVFAHAQPLMAGSFRLSKRHKSETKRNRQVFDMNMPCETETTMEILATDEIADKKVTGFKNFFDLNSCLTEDEAPAHSASSVVRQIRGFDLEAPAPHEIDEDNTFAVTELTWQEAELEHVAAEAMVLFSSFKNFNIMERAADAATETLKWFVGVVSSCPSDSVQQSSEYPLDENEEPIMRTSSGETDHFEQMTLNLTEMSAEECMPKSAFPTIPNIEKEPVNVILSARPRRGQSRQGKPKRDFQRDILPGITSLSRHEVTEDLQAFDGLMRSSGHAWQFGKRAAARNKPRRGRPRTVNVTPIPGPIPIPIPIYTLPKLPTNDCIGEGMKDRNLTGWGKNTRRPRRQRCPAGNLQPVRLS